MPRKSKEELKSNNSGNNDIENLIEKNKSEKATSKKVTTKNVSGKKTSAKKNETKKTTTKSTTKKSTVKADFKNVAKKSTKNSDKSTEKKSTAMKSVSSVVEYYDLPYRYNETTVKILAQTPTILFIYWDISDKDRANFVQKYGENFFNTTKPILIIRNKTMNYSFEVEINDFANSWYLHVNDANCDYSVELGRRPIEYNSNIDNYVYITTSNDIEMPNNHILFDELGKTVFFRNVKNNFTQEVSISSMSFMKNLGKFCNICDVYKEIYENEINFNELHSGNINLNLSSSSSSTFM